MSNLAYVLYDNRLSVIFLLCFSILGLLACIVVKMYCITKRDVSETIFSEKDLANYNADKHDAFDHINALRQSVAPEGVEPGNLSFLKIHDKKDCYIRSFTVDKIPRNVKFAETFSVLMNFENVTTSIFIRKMQESTAVKKLDYQVVILEGEQLEAVKNADRNRWRKLQGQIADVEHWASRIESGDNDFYEVGFLFSIRADSVEELNLLSDSFHLKAKEKLMEVSSCYGVQPEAYLSNGPYNSVFTAQRGLVKQSGIKFHLFDRYATTAIFNHTEEDFYHENGVLIGRNMDTQKPATFDPMDSSHSGFGIIFAGFTGAGKSATIKILANRLVDWGWRFAAIDSQRIGNRGEYSYLAEELNGRSFQIKKDSPDIMNFFEIWEEEVEIKDENGNSRYEFLVNLENKVIECVQILKSIILNGKQKPNFEMDMFIDEILTDACKEIYDAHGIYQNDVESLYEMGKIVEHGVVTTGRVRKQMPTISECFKCILLMQMDDERENRKLAYDTIISGLKESVKEVIYSEESCRFFTAQEYESLPKSRKLGNKKVYVNESGVEEKVIVVRGIRSYYDGQSTIPIDRNCRFTNIDVSALPKEEQLLARRIGIMYINENFVRRNSENLKKAEKLIVISDEQHEDFHNEYSRFVYENMWRTARKKNVSPWGIAQSIVDYYRYDETRAMLSNSSVKILFKHDPTDRDELVNKVKLSESEATRVLRLGGRLTYRYKPGRKKKKVPSRKGELCLIDNGRVCFIKVDYLEELEWYSVETDIEKRVELKKKAG